jgi:hypothetical protein
MLLLCLILQVAIYMFVVGARNTRHQQQGSIAASLHCVSDQNGISQRAACSVGFARYTMHVTYPQAFSSRAAY